MMFQKENTILLYFEKLLKYIYIANIFLVIYTVRKKSVY